MRKRNGGQGSNASPSLSVSKRPTKIFFSSLLDRCRVCDNYYCTMGCCLVCVSLNMQSFETAALDLSEMHTNITFFRNEIKDILMEHYYISIATLLAALILVTLFVFFEGLRFTIPLNWLVSILIVSNIKH